MDHWTHSPVQLEGQIVEWEGEITIFGGVGGALDSAKIEDWETPSKMPFPGFQEECQWKSQN